MSTSTYSTHCIRLHGMAHAKSVKRPSTKPVCSYSCLDHYQRQLLHTRLVNEWPWRYDLLTSIVQWARSDLKPTFADNPRSPITFCCRLQASTDRQTDRQTALRIAWSARGGRGGRIRNTRDPTALKTVPKENQLNSICLRTLSRIDVFFPTFKPA